MQIFLIKLSSFLHLIKLRKAIKWVVLTVLFPLCRTAHFSTTDSFSNTVTFKFWLLSKNGSFCCAEKISIMKWERKFLALFWQQNKEHEKEMRTKKTENEYKKKLCVWRGSENGSEKSHHADDKKKLKSMNQNLRNDKAIVL